MKQTILVILFLSFSFLGYTQTAEQSKAIDSYIKNVIQINEIPGMAVGVVKNDKVIFQQYYGRENLESDKKVNSNTMFRIYSNTKLMSNIGTFKLIEEGKLSLEDKISKYIDNLPKGWQNIQVKNLLSHSSGLPDMADAKDLPEKATNNEVINRLSKEKMEFETGDHYRYNQTNYLLIAMIIEKITGKSFEDYILDNQFPDAKNHVVFSSNSVEKIPNRVGKYNYNSTKKQYEKLMVIDGLRSHSSNGLAVTLPAFLQWSIHFSKNDFLKPETKKIMWQPFNYKNNGWEFAHGWEITDANTIRSYGFSGGNVSAYSIFPENNMAIVVMYNGNKGFPVMYQMINHIAGIMDKHLMNPYALTEEITIAEPFVHPNLKKEVYGYRTENDKVVFSYRYPKGVSPEFINTISVAGAFNNWNPEDKSYQLVLKDKNKFELALPKTQFEKGKTYGFKFVMNKNGWLTVPYNASNIDGTQDNNLTLRID
ncbi:serine hydrolase [Chryseobacterium lactis]|uniref:Serine hydrolase n=1 Tax=Chryseobacterium lactis TaxID=1241981 RepID=A0A3G6RNY3_CHRLC|nr:serine hydrolase [Chryseobacterium lactis]AZA80541.1 serine hydrolase [Chryseobacterium lactis]AZB05543.1 serine hydrolase [Chryseobacterium lactis]PNW11323.1 serine hydrolase [Chryseobacterium lactis]